MENETFDSAIEEFNSFLDFLKIKYPGIKKEFSEWQEKGKKKGKEGGKKSKNKIFV